MVLGLAAVSASGVSKMNCRNLMSTIHTGAVLVCHPSHRQGHSYALQRLPANFPTPPRLWLTARAHILKFEHSYAHRHLLTSFPPETLLQRGWSSVMKKLAKSSFHEKLQGCQPEACFSAVFLFLTKCGTSP